MKRRGKVDTGFLVAWWVFFALGLFTHNEWLVGPAAFFILLDKVEHA